MRSSVEDYVADHLAGEEDDDVNHRGDVRPNQGRVNKTPRRAGTKHLWFKPRGDLDGILPISFDKRLTRRFRGETLDVYVRYA